jgi:hypothetical protein
MTVNCCALCASCSIQFVSNFHDISCLLRQSMHVQPLFPFPRAVVVVVIDALAADDSPLPGILPGLLYPPLMFSRENVFRVFSQVALKNLLCLF